MVEQELRDWKQKFERMGIRFVCENQPGTGAQVGGILATATDAQGRIWHAINGHLQDNLMETLREVLVYVAGKGF
jgi:hypothetical protein